MFRPAPLRRPSPLRRVRVSAGRDTGERIAWLRRAFDRRAAGYDSVARVQREISRRLLEHLDPIRVQPTRAVDVGSATGFAARALASRYRSCEVVSVDLSSAMLRIARSRAPRWRSRHRHVCADASALPLAAASADLLTSSMSLPWTGPIDTVLAEWARVLRHGGLLLLAVPGPDTLGELRAAWAGVDDRVHVDRFPDMHDVGDALVAAGFADVVVDAERLRVDYEDFDHLTRELHGSAPASDLSGHARGLTPPARLAAVREHYARPPSGGALHATLEVAYAHAWRVDRDARAVAPPAAPPRDRR